MAEKDQRATDTTEAEQQGATATEEEARSERERELERQLEEARAKAEENWDNYLRARAEIENIRRRAERDLEQAHKYGLEKFAAELLPVKDSLEMGVVAAQDANSDVAKLREGAELTLRMLNQVFERFKLVEVNPQGERFDPSKHEAMAAQESSEHEPNTVINVIQKGYLLHDRVLRPAMVVVAKAAQGTGGTINEKA